MVDRNSPVLLSSSSTSSLPSDPAGIGGTNLDHAAQDPVQPKMQLTLSPRLEQQQQQCKPATAVNAERVPDYARKSIEELKKVAVSYGLRVNTPRRLLVHQLTTIWMQTHSNAAMAESSGISRSMSASDPTQQLHGRLRSYIRTQHDLYERILCYQALDFDEVYQRISAAVPCQKHTLRRFFDIEGIVSNSNVGH
ncbi:hypothetical protein H4S02_006055 [Coemansia sp. RSA 2611]|nr:hypothetical protein H4S02_006055 [Coemansia sp. RSA 2611]